MNDTLPDAIHAAALLNALPAHAALLDARGCLLAVNAGWRTCAGKAGTARGGPGALPAEAGLGMHYLQACALAHGPGPDQAATVAQGLRQVLTGELPAFSLDYPCPTPQGPRWFRVQLSPLALGGERGALVQHLDITDHVQAQQRALEGEARYRAMFDRHALPMWVYDPATMQFQAVNDAAVAHYGYTRDEFLSMDLTAIRPPEDVPALRAEIASLRQQPPAESRQLWRHRRKDGSLIRVEIHARPVTWHGRPARLVLAQDVTERSAAEEALRESEQRFRQIADGISEVFWLTEGGRLLYLSPGYETIWQRSSAELLGHTHRWLDSVHPDDRERVRQALPLQASGGFDIEYRIVRPDGSVRWVADRAFAVPAAGPGETGSGPARLAGVARDITERKRLEQQLQQSQRLESLGQLTGGVAHDFNNLLTVMLGNAELLAEQLPAGSAPQRLAQMIGSAAQRGGELTQRLLAFARRQALAPHVVDLNRLVTEMDGLLRRTLGGPIEVVHRPAADLWPTLVDPTQLENALLNLAINARDAMPRGGRLVFETHNTRVAADGGAPPAELAPGDYAVISVADNGCGIPAADLGRVFEPFFTTKERGKGTGLGLAMVYGFVKQSQGHVTLQSEPDQGTTVRIYLPRHNGGPAYVRPADDARAPLGAGQQVLLVEDDTLVRRFAREQLLALNYRVLEAADGAQALALLQQHDDIELLFTDVVMPGGMSGAELATAARALRPRLPVLYTSGYTASALTQDGRLHPGVRLLGKPYRRAELAQKLQEALRGIPSPATEEGLP